ncbi:MAG TPA: element excision factor XisI family protein [Aggregatilineales bacterium]|nr:element excision factor XisI family protein [Aggregatilineales bacterium]
MDTLRETLIQELDKYTGKAFNGYSYLTASADQSHFVITSVGYVQEQRIVNTAIIVQIVNGKILIDRDIYDKQLVDALLQVGIPREKIILAYAGEPVPTAV